VRPRLRAGYRVGENVNDVRSRPIESGNGCLIQRCFSARDTCRVERVNRRLRRSNIGDGLETVGKPGLTGAGDARCYFLKARALASIALALPHVDRLACAMLTRAAGRCRLRASSVVTMPGRQAGHCKKAGQDARREGARQGE